MDLLPRKIRIGPIDFDVKEIERLLGRDEIKKLNGHIKYNECEILVESTMNPQMKFIAVWHEIVHGIMCQAEIEEHDEKLISVIAHGIVGVLRDNEDLRKNNYALE